MDLSKLSGKQTDVLYLEPNKHNVVLGVAGGGKTLVAMLRAKYLANLCTDNGERVLLTTYNTTLNRYFYLIEEDKPNNLDICVYHKFARGYLKSKGKMQNNCILRNKNKLVHIAKEKVKEKYKDIKISSLDRFAEVFVEEITWIEKMGIENLQEYMLAERIGRGNVRITRENRKYFFEVYQLYLELRKENGNLYDWDDIATTVNNEMISDADKKYYKHIIIDEGQDFSPVMLRSLANSIPEDGSLTFFGDVAQQIYGNRYSWRDAGIKITSSSIYKFEQNYRNSKEISDFASDIKKSPYWKKDEDNLETLNVKVAGPKPVLIEFQDEMEERHAIIEYVRERAGTENVAVLLRDNKKVEDIIKSLEEENIQCQKLNKYMKNDKSVVLVGTYHSSKGLEFDTVFLPFLNDQEIPSIVDILIHGDENIIPNEIKLFYVVVTRAKSGLIMTYTGDLTEIFPKESENYVKGEIVVE